mmetsp:Transcript_10027/g.20037  ORF Transcript_10027/g.20037 Transcript_10027/m.20037 type:complete len:208 (+) Transcript_10027:978-1601(+)
MVHEELADVVGERVGGGVHTLLPPRHLLRLPGDDSLEHESSVLHLRVHVRSEHEREAEQHVRLDLVKGLLLQVVTDLLEVLDVADDDRDLFCDRVPPRVVCASHCVDKAAEMKVRGKAGDLLDVSRCCMLGPLLRWRRKPLCQLRLHVECVSSGLCRPRLGVARGHEHAHPLQHLASYAQIPFLLHLHLWSLGCVELHRRHSDSSLH